MYHGGCLSNPVLSNQPFCQHLLEELRHNGFPDLQTGQVFDIYKLNLLPTAKAFAKGQPGLEPVQRSYSWPGGRCDVDCQKQESRCHWQVGQPRTFAISVLDVSFEDFAPKMRSVLIQLAARSLLFMAQDERKKLFRLGWPGQAER